MVSTLMSSRDTATLEVCGTCQRACESCAYDCCAASPDMATCTRVCLDCATICAATATLIARGSPWAPAMATLCVSACEQCAAECGKHDDPDCQECAATCSRCADQCRPLAASTS
jgi:hypothetical protein